MIKQLWDRFINWLAGPIDTTGEIGYYGNLDHWDGHR